MTGPANNLPVIVGAGQLTNRADSLRETLSPLDMMERVARSAASDAGLASMRSIDTIASLPVLGWRSPNPAGALARRLGIDVRRSVRSGDDGDIGIVLLNWLAQEIQAGRCGCALLVMSNNLKARALAASVGTRVDWPVEDQAEPELVRAEKKKPTDDEEEAIDLVLPIQLYPIIENAIRAAHGRTLDEHRDYMGNLFAPFSQVAKRNPHAWFPTAYSPEEITSVTGENRMVCFPTPSA